MDHFDTSSSGACVTCHGKTNEDGTYTPGTVSDNPYFDSRFQRLIIGERTDASAGGSTNLTNDHPIGVIYRGAGDAGASASLRAKTVLISSLVMAVAKGERGVASPVPAATDAAATASGDYFGALVTGNLWAVKGFISDNATIQDLLRSGSGQGSGNYVQCSSCHDPHFKNQTNPEAWFWNQVRQYESNVRYYDTALMDGVTPAQMVPVTSHQDFEVNGLFLRRVGGNSDSGLCRTCHDKQ